MGAAIVYEAPVVIPGAAPLVGTLSTGGTRSGPGVLLLNAGLVQRAGPDGLHVRLAGTLAGRGVLTLRLDYSGVGDSPARRDRTPLLKARIDETRAALDWLETEHGVREFVLAGICTGADNAFQAALEDERVKGLLLLDGYPYRTAGWWIRHYGARLFRASSWRTLMRRGAGPPRAPAAGRGLDDPPEWDGIARQIPPREEMAAHLKALIDRGTQIYFIYTGGFSEWVNHAGQLRSAMRGVPFGDSIVVDYVPQADHVFRPAASQADLAVRFGQWLDQRWPPPQAVSEEHTA